MSGSSRIPLGEFASISPQQTFELGHAIGSRLRGGEILLLSGPLGAGKTILVKGLCAALVIDEEDVTSPSFTLVNPYDGRLRLYHLDLYRLDEGASAADGGRGGRVRRGWKIEDRGWREITGWERRP